ncbi:unnamed protein product [Spodoptera exigua]|nr:unnamed protein product [Spodoptera exigua]
MRNRMESSSSSNEKRGSSDQARSSCLVGYCLMPGWYWYFMTLVKEEKFIVLGVRAGRIRHAAAKEGTLSRSKNLTARTANPQKHLKLGRGRLAHPSTCSAVGPITRGPPSRPAPGQPPAASPGYRLEGTPHWSATDTSPYSPPTIKPAHRPLPARTTRPAAAPDAQLASKWQSTATTMPHGSGASSSSPPRSSTKPNRDRKEHGRVSKNSQQRLT